MELSAKYSDAVEYARCHHVQDVRKGTAIPYLAHVLAVSAIVLEHGGDEVEAIAALLHDVVEDGGGQRALSEITERFGSDIASIVEGCSDTTAEVEEDWQLCKMRYLDHLETAAEPILLVSAADKLHNARAILEDLREHGAALWSDSTVVPEISSGITGRWPRCSFDRSGAFIDWPGWPLIVDFGSDGPVVRAEVGIGGDYCSDVDPDLDEYLDLELEGVTLSYDMDTERAWLTCRADGNLQQVCERVARLAPDVAVGLRVALAFDEPTFSYATWLEGTVVGATVNVAQELGREGTMIRTVA